MDIGNMKELVRLLPPELLEKRAEEVSPEEFASLANTLYELIRHEHKDIQG
jgi:hypothetical protein